MHFTLPHSTRVLRFNVVAQAWIFAMLLSVSVSAAERKGKMAPPAVGPAITRLEPRGIQRGVPIEIRLTGTKLEGLTNIVFSQKEVQGEVISSEAAKAVVRIAAGNALQRGPQEFTVKGTAGESAKVKLYVDDLPQAYESEMAQASRKLEQLPVNAWGTLKRAGQVDQYEFTAEAGKAFVFELSTVSLGSKAVGTVLTLVDELGRVLASNGSFDGGEPLIVHTFQTAGRYSIRVSDLTAEASADHFYRLTLGVFPYVAGVFPLSVPAKRDAEISLLGFNLPAGAVAKLGASEVGDVLVPVDASRFRSRRAFKVVVSDANELVESEPNDMPATATPFIAPAVLGGRIWSAGRGSRGDVDLYRFEAQKGGEWIIETLASRAGSPVDTRVEILNPDGTPVPRLLLQAVRDSYINFRGVDANNPDIRVKNWEEMDLRQYLFLQGDVARIIRMPRGPDSGFLLYNVGGKRRAYFDTTATGHANEETCYVVEPHPPGIQLVPNGLPQFTLYYENDDDGERKLGPDSRIHFTAPRDGAFLLRVTDSRGFEGDRNAYRLIVRKPMPDFTVTLRGANPSIGRGAGVGFSVAVDRKDGFEGEIAVAIEGLPEGISASTPVVIEAGLLEADGALFAKDGAQQPGADALKKVVITASAMIGGKRVSKKIGDFGQIKVVDAPKFLLSLSPPGDAKPSMDAAQVITISPGQTIPMMLRAIRNGDTNLVNLDVDNLPHGIIVDNIGLNGVQIRAGEDEREIFLTAAKWVPESERFCHAVVNSARALGGSAGLQTSYPVLLRVRKAPAAVQVISNQSRSGSDQ
jgi:hypothetical protein